MGRRAATFAASDSFTINNACKSWHKQRFCISCGSTLPTHCALNHLRVVCCQGDISPHGRPMSHGTPMSSSKEKQKQNLQQLICCPDVSARVGVTRFLVAVLCHSFFLSPATFGLVSSAPKPLPTFVRIPWLSLRACWKGEYAGYLQCNPVSGCARMAETCLGTWFKTLRVVLFPGGCCGLLVYL